MPMPLTVLVNSDVPDLQASIYSERRAQRVLGAVAVSLKAQICILHKNVRHAAALLSKCM